MKILWFLWFIISNRNIKFLPILQSNIFMSSNQYPHKILCNDHYFWFLIARAHPALMTRLRGVNMDKIPRVTRGPWSPNSKYSEFLIQYRFTWFVNRRCCKTNTKYLPLSTDIWTWRFKQKLIKNTRTEKIYYFDETYTFIFNCTVLCIDRFISTLMFKVISKYLYFRAISFYLEMLVSIESQRTSDLNVRKFVL